MYTLTIKLLSPTMLMSGQGDVNTDSTIVHDRYGIPFILLNVYVVFYMKAHLK